MAADLDWQSIAEAGALVRVIDDIENDPVEIVTAKSDVESREILEVLTMKVIYTKQHAAEKLAA